MTKTAELREFVINQAAEDAVLAAGERRFQEKLVSDVLGQEAPTDRLFRALLSLYRAERKIH